MLFSLAICSFPPIFVFNNSSTQLIREITKVRDFPHFLRNHMRAKCQAIPFISLQLMSIHLSRVQKPSYELLAILMLTDKKM